MSDAVVDEDTRVGSLEGPLVVGGKRDRKAPEVFKVAVVEKIEFAIQPGKGKRVGDLPDVCSMLEKHKGASDVLQQLHTVAFGRKGPMAKVKAHLRDFSGFPFDAAARETELAKRSAFLSKRTGDELKEMLAVCCLERSGKKEELVGRLVDFFDKPTSSGHAAPASAAKRKRAATPSAKGKRAPSPASKAEAKPAAAKRKPAAPPKKAGGKDAAAGIAKPPSALELYMAARLPSLREKNDGVPDAELEGHLKDKWKVLPADKKDKFEEEHKAAKAKYDKVCHPPRLRARDRPCVRAPARSLDTRAELMRCAAVPLCRTGSQGGQGGHGQARDHRRRGVRRRRRG
jgi:hypothetical protein